MTSHGNSPKRDNKKSKGGPPPPPPPPAPLRQSVSRPAPRAAPASAGSIEIGIETESLLQTQSPTIGGLCSFIQCAGLPQGSGLNDSRYLDQLFSGKDKNSSLQPRPVGKLTPDKELKLAR
ncbi:MAG: hypothetical protein M1834_008046 [Cirrosporium novae-zelandiae]|nr:MAG: hypothetical protein M1834_008046 [Cirrosporium novae-zelandiae]